MLCFQTNRWKRNGNLGRLSKWCLFISDLRNLIGRKRHRVSINFKTDISVDLKLTSKPTTYTNFLHVQAFNQFEDPIWEDHGERIPAMVQNIYVQRVHKVVLHSISKQKFARLSNQDQSNLYSRESKFFADLQFDWLGMESLFWHEAARFKYMAHH